MLAERSRVWELLGGGDEITCHITGKINQKKKKSHSIFFVLLSSSSGVRLIAVVSPLTLFRCNLKRGCELWNIVECLQLKKKMISSSFMCLSKYVYFERSSPLTFFFFVSWVSTCSNSSGAFLSCALGCLSHFLPATYLVDHNYFSQRWQQEKDIYRGLCDRLVRPPVPSQKGRTTRFESAKVRRL